VSPKWMEYTGRCLKTLQVEDSLNEIVKLVGVDALSAEDRLTLESARSIREDFLQQNAFEDEDCYTALDKQYALLELVFAFEDKARRAIADGADIEKLSNLPVRERIGRFKAVPYAEYKAEAEKITAEMTEQLDKLVQEAKLV
ncbi:MAG: V-type ATP synthase subunit A, partial [Clostridia bacterium]|nr:V-type ATP synthase subunit A [Clostridia bacterium]